MRKLEDMCVVCNDHDKPSCGYEVRKLQRKCPYNDFIERGYDLAEQDFLALVKQYIEKGERCMKQSIDDGEGDLYTFWDGFHNCAENILRELEEKK